MGPWRTPRKRTGALRRGAVRASVVLAVVVFALAGCVSFGPAWNSPAEFADLTTDGLPVEVPAGLSNYADEVSASEQAIAGFLNGYERWAGSSFTRDDYFESANSWVLAESPVEGDMVRAAHDLAGVNPGGDLPTLVSREVNGWEAGVLSDSRPIEAIAWEYCYVLGGGTGDAAPTCAIIATNYNRATGWKVDAVMPTEGEGSPYLPW